MQGKVRLEPVVPISSKYGGLTMAKLHSFFFLGPGLESLHSSRDGSKHRGSSNAAATPRGKEGGPQSAMELDQPRGEQGQGQEAGTAPNSKDCSQTTSTQPQQDPPQAAKHIMLAIADDDGSVSLMRMFSHIQPPFEGPEVLPDAMGVDEEGQESDEDG